MKRLDIVILVLVLVFLASGIVENPISRIARSVVGNVQEAWTTPKIQPDMPTRTQGEVCALVYSYLENKVSSVSAVPYRMNLLNALDMARPYFQAVYQGNGKWQVRALGCSINNYYHVESYSYSGLWNFYEASGVIEPANGEASELLRYIQRWTQ